MVSALVASERLSAGKWIRLSVGRCSWLSSYRFFLKRFFLVSSSGPNDIIKSHSFFVKLRNLLTISHKASVPLMFTPFCFSWRLQLVTQFMILGSLANGQTSWFFLLRLSSFGGSASQLFLITLKALLTLPITWRAADRIVGCSKKRFGILDVWAAVGWATVASSVAIRIEAKSFMSPA